MTNVDENIKRCEICERKNVTHCCAGLDVPTLFFCEDCALEHKEICPAIQEGMSELVRTN